MVEISIRDSVRKGELNNMNPIEFVCPDGDNCHRWGCKKVHKTIFQMREENKKLEKTIEELQEELIKELREIIKMQEEEIEQLNNSIDGCV